ncbi:MAG TPA: AbrB/MazE/SpoVT family DNA-binding domain-containing protein [Caulobacteraceae bacterium]|jgi:hypothetical protein
MSPEQMAQIIQPHTTVSDKIRALDAAGVARADIARFLGKRYQHVRNVLEADAVAAPGYAVGRADLSGLREADRSFDPNEPAAYEDRGGAVFRLLVREDGSVVLPPAALEALNLKRGHGVIARIDQETFTLISAAEAMRRVQALVRAHTRPGGGSVVDELIAERRREAEREEADG